MMEICKVSIADILAAREKRVERQRLMIEKHHAPLISFTMNIAGPIKNDEWIERAFREGTRRIEAVLSGRRAYILESCSTTAFTGCEYQWAVAAEAHALKQWMRLIEEQDELGRLFDIDVISADGAKLSRESERRCLICGGPVHVCSRSRAHSADELFLKTHEIIESYFRHQFVRHTAMAAEKSLLYELATTPKPGLVDFENSGAHSDMDRFTFINSACILRSYFESCAEIGSENPENSFESVFEKIRSAGQQAEAEMLAATGNINTHKGALFTLGILCCATGMCYPEKISLEKLLNNAAHLAQNSLSDFEKISPESARTGGEQQFLTGGLTGVRGEAAEGYPSVRNNALPALEAALANKKTANDASITALAVLMTNVADSNVLRRAGKPGLDMMQAEAVHIANADHSALREADARFIRANISPGGCADLLAAAWFLHERCN